MVTDRLENGETIAENILGLLVCLNMISDLSCKKIGVLTKVPADEGQRAEETSSLMLAAYTAALEIYVTEIDALESDIQWLKDFRLDSFLPTATEAQQLLLEIREQREVETTLLRRPRLVGQARRFAGEEAVERGKNNAIKDTVLDKLGIQSWLIVGDSKPAGDNSYFSGSVEAVNAMVAAACPGSKPITFGEKQAGQIDVTQLERHLNYFLE